MPKDTSKIILYNYFRSSCSYRVRLALTSKNLSYEYRSVHLVRDGGEQHQEIFKSLNPRGEVPFLIDGEQHEIRLSQSLVIIQYLDDQYPQRPLIPTSWPDKGLCWEISEMINSGIQPLHNLKVLKYLELELGASEQDKQEWVDYWIQHGLAAVERWLERYAGSHALGNQWSMADCCLLPQLHTAQRYKVDLSDFPVQMRLWDYYQTLEHLQSQAPQNCPDAQ